MSMKKIMIIDKKDELKYFDNSCVNPTMHGKSTMQRPRIPDVYRSVTTPAAIDHGMRGISIPFSKKYDSTSHNKTSSLAIEYG
jgi:hypothetical protein